MDIMRNYAAKLLFIFILSGLNFCSGQQSFNKNISQYVRQSWQTENGLPQNSITSISQTPDGYMWFGSHSGLVRFDGVTFTQFHSKNSKGINGDDIWCLKTDRQGRLWIGTNGSGLVCYEKGKFKTYTIKDGLSDNGIWSITEDKRGNLWIGTADSGINIYDGKSFRNINTSNGLSNNFIWTIIEDEEGNVWAGTDGGYINRISGKRIKVFNEARNYPGAYTMSGLAGRNNTLWFGAAGSGLIRYKDGSFKTYTINDGLSNDIILSILEDSKGNLWIGTEDGLSKLTQGKFSSFKESDGLQSSTVSAIYEDFEGNIWVAAKGGGISKFKDGIISSFSKMEGLSSNNVYSLLSDQNSDIWFCTGKGINLMRKDGTIKSFSSKDGLFADIILSVYNGKNGKMWFATDGGGLYSYQKGKFTRIDLSEYIPSNTIFSLYEDKGGTLWMGTDGYGLLSLSEGRIDWWTMGNGLSGEFISCIYEDSRGRIWAGTSDGTGLNEIIDDTVKIYTTKEGLLANDIWSISEDNEKCIWITTPNGLNKIENGRLYSYTQKNGLPDVQFYSVTDDNYGYLWMSSNTGIYKIPKHDLKMLDEGKTQKLNVVGFDVSDGMRSSKCNRGNPSVTKTKDGYLWFPTIKGAVVVDPRKTSVNDRKPNVIIEKVKVNDQISFNLTDTSFSPGSGDLEFYFTALSFAAIEKVKFKYMLEGWDKSWVNAGSRRSAFYTNLPPGKYKFRVIACNDAGTWNLSGASYEFEMQPYFYQTFWFYLLCGIAVSVIIFGIFKLRIKQLKKNEIILEQKVNERTSELERTNIILQTEIHERMIIEEALHNSLLEKEVMLKEIHHRVKNNLQVISSLLYLHSRKIKDDEVLSIFKESQNRVKSIALVHERLYQCANLSEIDFHDYIKRLTNELFRTYAGNDSSVKIVLDIEDFYINIDTAIPCALIINELVSNSFKYAFPPDYIREEKYIKICLKRVVENQFNITVSDNGIGLPENVKEKQKNSLGLHLVESLVKQLDGTIQYCSGPGTSVKMMLNG